MSGALFGLIKGAIQKRRARGDEEDRSSAIQRKGPPVGQDARAAALNELAGGQNDMQQATAASFAPIPPMNLRDPAADDEMRRGTRSMFTPAPMRRY